MKLFRYRKPSLNRLLGISAAKTGLRRATGVRAARHPIVLIGNFQGRVKRRGGYYAGAAKAVRNRHRWFGWFRLW